MLLGLANEEHSELLEAIESRGLMTMREHARSALEGSDLAQDPDCLKGIPPSKKGAVRAVDVVNAISSTTGIPGPRISEQGVSKPPYHGHKDTQPSRAIRSPDGSLPLYHYDHIPHWMQSNPFIRASYRAHYSVDMCIRSLFSIHNETANVWTHLLGLIFFLTFMLYAFATLIKPMMSHYVVFILFSLGCCMCMGCSALFHLFSAHHSEKVYGRMIMMDYFGITCLIIVSFYPVCYYAFTCDPFWRWMYMSIVTALGSIGLVGPFFDFFHHDAFFIPRLIIFCSLTGTGIFPMVHVNYIMPATQSTPLLQGMALMLFLYGIGVVVYVLKIPERLAPGRFDLWFHSHMLWHVFVLAAAVVHFFTCLGAYISWENMGTHC